LEAANGGQVHFEKKKKQYLSVLIQVRHFPTGLGLNHEHGLAWKSQSMWRVLTEVGKREAWQVGRLQVGVNQKLGDKHGKKREKNQRPTKTRGPLFLAFKSKIQNFVDIENKSNGSFDLCRLV